ncbi:hypothetical protein [Arthrobacter sp. SLBN-122]|uniref:hypothetical protein n=1 Tax=Arthrobacter sp. SLBN-122 TaxID=2768455 RepID=UPI00115461CF|nr:hypothetical protein [Arthrobacter sp. SLBN-122]TQJ33055.1 hypothetical protein FBY36_0259 [Arthrobacter sp. SLBN-122]
MDFLAFWMALGAAIISVIALWYNKRQAHAAETSATAAEKSATAAEKAEQRALTLERAMGYRWEIVSNGTDRYLIFNAGTRDAHELDVALPEFMAGQELHVEKVRPLEKYEFHARVKPGLQQAVGPQLPRLATIRWEDRTEGKPVHRVQETTLQEHNPA